MVSKLWYGNDESGGIWNFSTMAAIASSNVQKENYDILLSNLSREQDNNEYTFQFNQYVNNCSQRNIINAISQVLTSILFPFFKH